MTTPNLPDRPATWLVRREEYQLWFCNAENEPREVVLQTQDLGVVVREKAAREALKPEEKYRVYLQELRELVFHAETRSGVRNLDESGQKGGEQAAEAIASSGHSGADYREEDVRDTFGGATDV